MYSNSSNTEHLGHFKHLTVIGQNIFADLKSEDLLETHCSKYTVVENEKKKKIHEITAYLLHFCL